jgi:hypothetical protein
MGFEETTESREERRELMGERYSQTDGYIGTERHCSAKEIANGRKE